MTSPGASFIHCRLSRSALRAVQLVSTLLFIGSLLVFAPSPSVAAQQSLPGSFARAACPQGVAVEGFRVECGFLTVAESRSNGDGRTIRLAVAIVRSPNPSPARDAVVFLAGGPGQGALGLAPQLRLAIAPILTRRDVVLLDQRGTGFSQPALTCGLGGTEARFLPLQHGLFPLGLSAQEDRPAIIQRATALLIACGQAYQQQGINLRAYNTVENAADLEDLRVALGYEAWNLYGGSYGTRLALVTMQYRPETIRSAVLDSLDPPEYNFQVESFASYTQSLTRLFDTCAGDAQCNQAFPNLEEKYTTLVSNLNANPPAIPLVNPQTGETIDYLPITGVDVSVLIFQLFYSTRAIPILPALISTTADGNYTLLSDLLSELASDQEGPQAGG